MSDDTYEGRLSKDTIQNVVAQHAAPVSVIDRNEKKITIVSILLLLVAAGVFIYIVTSVFDFTVDDAFIFFRYARNLAGGIGPTYNDTLPRAEGYTSFLWMLLMALPHLLDIDPVVFAKGLGLLFTLSTFAITYALVTHLNDSLDILLKRLSAAVVLFMLAVFPPTAVHAISGMETGLFVFALTAFIYTAVRGLDDGKYLRYTPLLGLLCGLTRPEGNLVVLLVLIVLWMKIPKGWRKGFARNTLLAYLLPGALYFLWRVSYYGLLLPLPFFTKMSKQSGLPGLPVVADFILAVLPLVGVYLLFGFLKMKAKTGLVLAAVLPLLLLYIYPRHVMGFDWRFLYPTIPLLYTLSGMGIARILSAVLPVYKSAKDRNTAAIGLSLGICLVAGTLSLAPLGETLEEKHTYTAAMESVYRPLGEILGAYPYTGDPPTLAITDAGAIPYYSGWRVTDLNGYNDPVIAASREIQPDYILSQAPDVVILVSVQPDRFIHDNESYSRYFEEFMEAGLGILGVIEVTEDYYLWVLADPDSEVFTYLWSVLRS
jgi:hypothetical protein